MRSPVRKRVIALRGIILKAIVIEGIPANASCATTAVSVLDATASTVPRILWAAWDELLIAARSTLTTSEPHNMKPRGIEADALLLHRPWTKEERHIVFQGLLGRLSIAIEPVLGCLVFTGLTLGMIWRARHVPEGASLIWVSPIFALGIIGFLVYAIALILPPLRAFIQTFKPIFIVDGYLRYRGPDEFSPEGCSGYVAVLFEDRSVAYEWETFGEKRLTALILPALAEFSEYGGIHKIDGRSTGILPEKITPLGVGLTSRH